MMKHLFSPFRIRDRQLSNRIVMPGLASFLLDEEGCVTDKTVEHYRRRAAGGPAMVIMEACSVAPEGIVSRHQARIYDDRFIDGLSRIAAVVKAEGALPAVQIHHSGRQTSARVIRKKPFAPSPLPCPTIGGEVDPLTIEGIERIVRLFGEAALRAVRAGFELIEIHGAHGYLINQFLSGFSNVRADAYGGSTQARARFPVELIQEVRRQVGKDFPLSFKISAQEFLPEGLTVEESIEILRTLVGAGIDVVQVSAGCDGSPEWICQPMFMEKACLSESAARIRASLKVPVMAVGRINHPLVAESVLAQGKADLVCIGRGLLADPEMPKKAKEGRWEDIRVCIACNTCMESIFRKGRVECLVNPTLGREKEMELRPAERPKKVMVVGGGPGGLHVAQVAAQRGHIVSLYEKAYQLGGQLNLGAVARHKKEIRTLIDYLKRQVEKAGVPIRLGREVTIETVREERPDAVVLSTGSISLRPEIPGIDKAFVLNPAQAFDPCRPVPRKAVVLGGGATGCEIAHHLSENGSLVTIVEQLPKVAGQVESITRKILLKELKERKVRILSGCHLSAVEDGGARVADADGGEFFLEADAVVIAIGNRADNRLYEEIKTLGIPVYQIGDCLQPRSAKAAIYEGAMIGRVL